MFVLIEVILCSAVSPFWKFEVNTFSVCIQLLPVVLKTVYRVIFDPYHFRPFKHANYNYPVLNSPIHGCVMFKDIQKIPVLNYNP